MSDQSQPNNETDDWGFDHLTLQDPTATTQSTYPAQSSSPYEDPWAGTWGGEGGDSVTDRAESPLATIQDDETDQDGRTNTGSDWVPQSSGEGWYYVQNSDRTVRPVRFGQQDTMQSGLPGSATADSHAQETAGETDAIDWAATPNTFHSPDANLEGLSATEVQRALHRARWSRQRPRRQVTTHGVEPTSHPSESSTSSAGPSRRKVTNTKGRGGISKGKGSRSTH